MSHILSEVDGAVGRITLNRPDRMNAIDLALARGLADAVDELAEDDAVGVVVIGGAGGNFCAGGDFDEVQRLRSLGARHLRELFIEFARACGAIEKAPVPVIAAVKGAAAAGGFELMQAADIVLVADDARISDSHINFGMIPGGGSTVRLPRIVGRQSALGLLLSGDRLTGSDAVDLGLAYKSFPGEGFDDAIEAFIGRLASRDRRATKTIKRLVRAGLQASEADAVSAEIDAVVEHICGSAGEDSVTAFQARKA
ncbi:enoyl-CoA hydratase/isomerase family protein [Mycolicibacterium porcinum]|uniref:enoyl-CoA hydratase/isomerase family protein n=1 Tax=Mycolicibacterium porcinum TaxID=39693 RepID=UPI00118ED670|nr:enoyl-CoA hydratase/isomerase family protein [Mycolicibacterium porcinum]TVX99221.1 enoyl-CoA hydratase/isomerase family protein [Mycolicibacterium porcinum]